MLNFFVIFVLIDCVRPFSIVNVNKLCPHDWYYYGNSCYVILALKTDWLDGFKGCKNVSSDYLAINTQNELQFMSHLLKFIDGNHFYLGLEDYMRHDEFDENFLCESKYSNVKVYEKKCGTINKLKNCIEPADCDKRRLAICERDCSKYDCPTDKKKKLNPRNWLKKDRRCLDHKCKHSSICLPETNPKSRNPKTYKCKCKLGFEGEFCEIDKSSCSRFNCMNNSTCIASETEAGKFKCLCQHNFAGELCEINQACLNVTCLNSGQCIEEYDGNYTCMCGNYFAGNHCEIKGDDLILLENISSSLSIFGIAIMVAYCVIIISMDVMRFCFKIEPISLKEYRKKVHKVDLLKQIRKEKRAAVKRFRRIDRAINKMKQYYFLNVRFRSLKYIDDSSAASTNFASLSQYGSRKQVHL